MQDAYTTTLERYRQISNAHTENAVQRRAVAEQDDAAARGTLPAGTRVFNVDTGAYGVVQAPPPGFSLRSGDLLIRLDNGDVVTSSGKRLMTRPTPPSV